jgi:hypothetical protein
MGNSAEYRQKIIDKLIISGTEEDLALVEIIRRAQDGKQWGNNKGVIIGDAENIGEFATLIFHESAHDYLELDVEVEDEKACYIFSRNVCQRLDLPYCDELEIYGIDFCRLTTQYTDEERITAGIENIPPKIRTVLSIYSQI